MTTSSKIKAILSATFLSLSCLGVSGCPTKVQPAPNIILWQINGSPHKGYGCWTDGSGCVTDATTGKPFPFDLNGQRFTGAQCAEADDFKKMTNYWDYLIREAERRCQ